MKYYRESLKRVFDTTEELEDAEKKLEEEKKEKAALAEVKKTRATEVEEAYKKTIEARKQAQELIRKADEEFEALKKKFIDDYGYFHMSFSDEGGKQIVTVNDLIEDFLGNFPFIW